MRCFFKKNIKGIILGIFIGLLLASTSAYAATILFQSNQVGYDNTDSGMTATDVQDAIDELYEAATGSDCPSGYTKSGSDTYKCIIAPSSFSTDSWDTIVENVKIGNSNTYTVGSTKTVDLGTFGIHTLRVANNSTPATCSGAGFSQTACGFVLEFVDIIGNFSMDSTGANTNVGGWPATSMRATLNSTLFNALPTTLKNAIVDTMVISGHGPTSGENNFVNIDKLYLLSAKEVGFDSTYDTAKTETRILDYYNVNNNNASRIKQYDNTNARWWLRTAYSTYVYFFIFIDSDGSSDGFNAQSPRGLSPAFRIA